MKIKTNKSINFYLSIMNKKILLAVFSLFLFGICNAQITASKSGIAIQGIARDANNTARANQNIALTLTFYYKDANSAEKQIVNLNETVSTDSFGVFSLTLDTNVNNNPIFANNESYLRIKDGNTTISDEKLKTVPYSISAANGVPTGSIMPYMGVNAPAGWVLCDGRTLTGINGSEKLKALLNKNNVPDLRGFFLRGAGSNGFTEKTTSVGVAYDDTNLSHSHAVNIDTSSDGAYNPTDQQEVYNRLLKFDGTFTIKDSDNTGLGREPNLGDNGRLNIPAHKHNVSGNTFTDGNNESAPVHFGVNYIIKL